MRSDKSCWDMTRGNGDIFPKDGEEPLHRRQGSAEIPATGNLGNTWR